LRLQRDCCYASLPGTGVTSSTSPRTIHDFGGFPPELFRVQYPAPGEPDLARRVQQRLAPLPVTLDNTWGLDHGTFVGVFSDEENKYEVQRIRCTDEQEQQHGLYLWRVTYYTFRRDGRRCLEGQMGPIMNEAEMRSLLGQIAAKNCF
jgi:hypothetical protein